MASTANPNSYDSYKDCSQGICSIYCPQWCHIIFSPPPPSFFLDGDCNGGCESSSSDFFPLLIASIIILAGAFILFSYYTFISKLSHSNSPGGASGHNPDISSEANGTPAMADGLDEAVIKSIAVYKYKEGDGFVGCSDCSVCLSEFEENERLRLLPKCDHAFHVICIDTWLKSHSNCPLCRGGIATVTTIAPATAAAVTLADISIPV